MNRGKHIKITIGVDGSCRIDAMLFTDASCQTFTKEITSALGGGIVQEHAKPEARVPQRAGQADRQASR
jgi:hypothetical protein